MLKQQLKTSPYFYLHIFLVILGLVLPIFLHRKNLVYVLIFVLIVLLHWILLGGDCIISYLDRMMTKRNVPILEESFFYKLFKKYFDIKIKNIHVQLLSILLMLYIIIVCIYRLYFKKSKKEEEN